MKNVRLVISLLVLTLFEIDASASIFVLAICKDGVVAVADSRFAFVDITSASGKPLAPNHISGHSRLAGGKVRMATFTRNGGTMLRLIRRLAAGDEATGFNWADMIISAVLGAARVLARGDDSVLAV